MIVKAEIKQRNKSNINTTPETVVKRFVPKDKRYLICVNPDDESKSGYVFDIKEQRIVYKITTKNDKTIEQVFDSIYSSFKRSDTIIVDHTVILNAIVEIPEEKKRTNTFAASIKIQEESKEISRIPIAESIHIKKIKETYKYIDKYKVKLNVGVRKINEDIVEIDLFDKVNGIDKGIHILRYDYNKGNYSYYYGPKLIVLSNNLEDIFK